MEANTINGSLPDGQFVKLNIEKSETDQYGFGDGGGQEVKLVSADLLNNGGQALELQPLQSKSKGDGTSEVKEDGEAVVDIDYAAADADAVGKDDGVGVGDGNG